MSAELDRHDCDQSVHAGAYVLGALEPDEARRFADHLDSCAACRREVAELQSTVDVLPAAVPRLTAPSALHDRVMATVRAEAQLLAAAGPEADRARPQRTRRRTRRLALLAAAVAAVPVAAGIIAGLIVAGSSTPAPATHVLAAQVIGMPASASAQVRETAGTTELVVSHFAEPPAGKIYQVWLQGSNGTYVPTDSLFSVNRDGSGSVGVSTTVPGAQRLLVTAEPLGGSRQPTSSPVIVANLHAA